MAEAKLRMARHTARFTIAGKVKLSNYSLTNPTINPKGNWEYVRDNSFGIDVGDGREIYPVINGGRDIVKNIFYAQGVRDENGKSEFLEVPIDYDEEWNEKISSHEFRHASLEKEFDEKGRLVRKSFADTIAYLEYLQGHLANGMNVVVKGNVKYQKGKDQTYRKYEITNIYLNLEDEDGELKTKPDAYFEQTYLLDEYSLSRTYSRELTKDGKTIISAKVAEFLDQVPTEDGYVKYKKVAPLTQGIAFKIDNSDPEKVKKAGKVIEKLFSMKKGKVREVIFDIKINEGYDKVSGAEIEMDDTMRELVEAGYIDLEDHAKRSSVRGAKINELIFNGVIPLNLDGKSMVWDDERFSPEALIFVKPDSDEDDEEVKVSKEIFEDDSEEEEVSLEDNLNATFSDLFAD